MILESIHLRNAASGAMRVEQHDGREHFVFPVVALIGGQVIHAVNARNAERISTEHLAKSIASFEGKPVVFGHPVRDGKQISANSPEVLEKYGLGKILTPRMSGDRFLMDIAIDPARAEKLGGAQFVEDLRASLPCDVSVGAFVTCDDKPGEINGKKFSGTWLETLGDHLAILWPHMKDGIRRGVGACSWESGCGLRAAMHLVTAEGTLVTASEFEALGDVVGHEFHGNQYGGSTATSDAGRKAETASTKADSKAAASYHAGKAKELQDKRVASKAHEDAVEAHLKATETGSQLDFTKANIASDRAHQIEAKARTTKARYAMSLKQRFLSLLDGLKQKNEGPESLTDAEIRTLLGEEEFDAKGFNEELRTLVGARNSAADSAKIQAMHDHAAELGAECDVQNTRFMASKTKDCPTCDGIGQVEQKDCPTCEGSGEMKVTTASGEPAEGDNMTKEERAAAITALTSCPCSGFTTAHTKMLEAATDDQIAAFRTAGETRKAEQQKLTDLEAKVTATEGKVATTEAALKAAQAAQIPADELVNLRALATTKATQDAAEKTDLVGKLKTAGTLTEEQLNVKSLDDLRTLAAFAKVEVADFSGRGIAVPRAAAAVDFTPPNPYEAGIKALQGAKQ